jgi:hypothetical protein
VRERVLTRLELNRALLARQLLLRRRRLPVARAPREHRAAVIRRNGAVQQTFLVDGLVAGTWQVEEGRLPREPLARLPARVRRELEAEGRGLVGLHG